MHVKLRIDCLGLFFIKLESLFSTHPTNIRQTMEAMVSDIFMYISQIIKWFQLDGLTATGSFTCLHTRLNLKLSSNIIRKLYYEE